MEVKIEGVEELIRKLDSRTLFGGAMRNFWNLAGLAFLRQAAMRAPVDTGTTRKSLLAKGSGENVWEMDTSDLPMWVKVGTAVQNNGFCYPRALDESDRYHYKGGRAEGRVHPLAKGRGGLFTGPTERMGTPTKGWFSEALPLAIPDIQKALTWLAEAVARVWGK